MQYEFFKKIKKLTTIAFFSDDILMNMLVLKGGNALDLIYNIAGRASIDIDFSIIGKIEENRIEEVKLRIFKTLDITFNENGYKVFDYVFYERPPKLTKDMEDFWGGYKIEFKIIEKLKFLNLSNDLNALRRNAFEFDAKHRRVFSVDISKFEYCHQKMSHELEGLRIYAYSPDMILFEKLRAICQQMTEYGEIVKSKSQSARAKDFYDIFLIIEKLKVNPTSEQNLRLIEAIFEAKKVPLNLIGNISKYREYHRADFQVVMDTVFPDEKLNTFDFYFDYVINLCELLKPLWVK